MDPTATNEPQDDALTVIGRESAPEALRDPRLIPGPGPEMIEALSGGQLDVPLLIRLSGADHRRRRRAVAVPFGPPRVDEWEATVSRLAEACIPSGLGPGAAIELSEAFGWPLIQLQLLRVYWSRASNMCRVNRSRSSDS